MKIIDNIKTFLYDKNYFINVFEDKIHVFNYLDLLKLEDNEIILQMEYFKFFIIGDNLHIVKMADRELMVKGDVMDLRFKR